MRIWHQSITDLSRQVNYAANLATQAATICDPGTVVDLHGVDPASYPPGLSAGMLSVTPWGRHMIDVQIIENARRAEREGYDAVAIACFHDPGLHVARSVVDIPVVGMCETSLVTSMAYGGKFALICLHRPIIPFLQGLVESHGFGPRVVAIETIEPSVSGLELEAVYDDPTLLHTRVKEAAERAAAAGADVLIPAENILNTLFVHHQIPELAGMPVIDTYGAMLAHAEMLVRLRQRRGLQVSRRNTYLRPRDDMLEAMRHASGRALAADS